MTRARTQTAALAAPQSSATTRILLALAAALALTAAIPSIVHASPAKQTQAVAAGSVTDFSSAARRHRHVAHRAHFRNAYGAIPGPVYEAPSYGTGYQGYGYGYGDNSRNQTW